VNSLDLTVVIVTSQAVNSDIVDYYVGLAVQAGGGANVSEQNIRSRLHMLDCGDATGGVPLTDKILARPKLVERLRNIIGVKAAKAAISTITCTASEARLASLLRLPLLAASPSAVAACGTKSGSRSMFEAAGVRFPPGTSLSFSVDELAVKIERHVAKVPPSEIKKLVVKLDESFSGQGNAVLKVPGGMSAAAIRDLLPNMKFMGMGVTWDTYMPQIRRIGVRAAQSPRPCLTSMSQCVSIYSH